MVRSVDLNHNFFFFSHGCGAGNGAYSLCDPALLADDPAHVGLGNVNVIHNGAVLAGLVAVNSYRRGIVNKTLGDDFKPDMVAGHSLGEFSALVAAGVLPFEQGLKLVETRALAMQKACEATPSTMAAIIGMDDDKVE